MNWKDIVLSEMSQAKQTNSAWSHFHEELKTVSIIHTDSRNVVSRNRIGGNKRRWSRGIKLQLDGINKLPRSLQYGDCN